MLGMFGLEGSGFTICLGLILLLTGIVMYYCKTKISQSNHKVDSMFSLITDLHDEVSMLKEEIQEIKHRKGVVAVSEDVEHAEDENSNGVDETGFSNHPYKELIPITIDNNAEESDSSQSEDDTDDEEEEDENNTNTIKMHEETETGQDNIKVVDLGEIEDLKVEDSESEHNSGTETETESDEESESQSVSPVDYSKLQVVALKRLVSERKLATNVNKLRKAQLVQILQSA